MKHFSKKPLIAVLPLWDSKKDSLWMLPGYFGGLIEQGAVPVMLPLCEDEQILGPLLTPVSGVLLPGGQDTDPALYSEKPQPECGEICPLLDRMSLKVLELVLALDLPLLGICRGIQFLNVAEGGTLYQDLPTQHPGNIVHCMQPPYDRVVHRVKILPGTPLHEALECDEIGVNSYHHQAVREVSPRLEVMAISEDGLVEGVYMKGQRFIQAVQWHPELFYKKDENSRRIFRAFVQACREYQEEA